jgi:hypothetical protein
MLVRLNSAKDK